MTDDMEGGGRPPAEEAERRRELWLALSVAEDWLAAPDPGSGWGGARLERELPEIAAFEPAAAAPVAGPAIDLEAEALAASTCTRCRLGSSRRHVAYGEGSPRPLVLAIGEGPGAEEDAQGRPFVGPAGQLLDRMLSSIGLSREENCYIANIVKCRPPGNRDPADDEKDACLPWLERQIEALRPRIILALGRVAATTLLRSDEGIGRLRGRWHERGGIPLIATYHPSALLRDESLKRPAWEDLKMLKFRLDDIASES
jgi:DNA polymerase